MNPIFLWIRVSTPRNPHWKITNARMQPTIHKISSHVISCHHPLKHAIFFWPSSYINRRSFFIPGNSWLSRFFFDLGGAENRCEILGRRMSGSSVGWFSDILDICLEFFREDLQKPWKTMGKTMVNPPNQSISDRFHPFFMVDCHPGKLRNCNFPPKWMPTAQNGSLHQQQNDGWSTNHRCFFPSPIKNGSPMYGWKKKPIIYSVLLWRVSNFYMHQKCNFSDKFHENPLDFSMPIFKSKHVHTRIHPWVIHGYQLYHLCHHIVDIIDLMV